MWNAVEPIDRCRRFARSIGACSTCRCAHRRSRSGRPNIESMALPWPLNVGYVLLSARVLRRTAHRTVATNVPFSSSAYREWTASIVSAVRDPGRSLYSVAARVVWRSVARFHADRVASR